ncbi:MAG: serine hydrolase domain-containing protein [Acidimicrobiia bacterium]
MSDRGFTKVGLERLHEVLTRHVDDGSHPGLVWMVARPGHVHVGEIGDATLADATAGTTATPMRRDTIFRISSMTKPVTATAAMMLVEDCRIRLDDPVDAWLPELANRRVLRALDAEVDDTVPANRPITVRDLLTFRCGYGMIMAEPGSLPILRRLDQLGMGAGPPQPGVEPDVDDWMARFTDVPLAHQPGEQWMYHTGADFLGVLIARASGQSFPDFLGERIFEPLGMVDTGFHVPEADVDRLATAYWRNPETDTLQVFDAAGGQWTKPPNFPSGGGGLVSTVDDFHAFSVMLASNGIFRGERLLSRPSAEVMMTDRLTSAQKAATANAADYWDSMFWDAFGWGFGMSVVTKRIDVETSPGRVGWDGGMGTAWTTDRTEQIVTMLMTQKLWDSPDPPTIVRDFRTAAYAAIDD